jgi:hypothetical protein
MKTLTRKQMSSKGTSTESLAGSAHRAVAVRVPSSLDERQPVGLWDILNLRVGCWRPPIHIPATPRANATRPL